MSGINRDDLHWFSCFNGPLASFLRNIKPIWTGFTWLFLKMHECNSKFNAALNALCDIDFLYSNSNAKHWAYSNIVRIHELNLFVCILENVLWYSVKQGCRHAESRPGAFCDFVWFVWSKSVILILLSHRRRLCCLKLLVLLWTSLTTSQLCCYKHSRTVLEADGSSCHSVLGCHDFPQLYYTCTCKKTKWIIFHWVCFLHPLKYYCFSQSTNTSNSRVKDFVLCQQRACKNIISSVLKVKTWAGLLQAEDTTQKPDRTVLVLLSLFYHSFCSHETLLQWNPLVFGHALLCVTAFLTHHDPPFLLKWSHLWGKGLHDDPFLLLRMLTCSYPPCHSWLLTGFSLGYQTKTLSLLKGDI